MYLEARISYETRYENVVSNYSLSCCSKPIRPSFIFGTQIKIFQRKQKERLYLTILLLCVISDTEEKKLLNTIICVYLHTKFILVAS